MEERTVARERPKTSKGKRAGYVIAIIINAAMLVVVNSILDWDVLPFLTQDFTRVLPLLNVSLAATIVANVAFLLFDPDWFVSLCRMVLNAVGIAVGGLFLTVFPFDFSAYPGFDWALLAKVMIILGIVGTSIGLIAETVKLVRALGHQTQPD